MVLFFLNTLIFIVLINPVKIKAAAVEFLDNAEKTEEEKDLEQKSQTLDLAIFLDNGSDVRDTIKRGRTGATSYELEQAIQQDIPFIATTNLIPLIKRYSKLYAKSTIPIFDYLLSNNWIVFQSEGPGTYVIGLPKSQWQNIDISSADNLKYLGFNDEKVKILNNQDIKTIANMSKEDQEKNFPLDKAQIEELESLFAKNPYVKKNIYMTGHGNEGSVAGLELDIYRKFLEFLNSQNVNILYIASCYAGGVNLLHAYQKKILDYTTPLNLNYFLFIGSLTDAETLSNPIDFKIFFDEIHTFFSSQGPAIKKPLESIGRSRWGKELVNIPSVRFPGSVNYFKALEVDDKIEIITYAKARAAELEESIAKQRGLKATKDAINIPSNKEIILMYPPVIKAPINLQEDFERLKIISMMPGNAIHYIDTLNTNFSVLYRISPLFRWVEYADFEAKKLIFINHAITKKEQGSIAIYIDGSCITFFYLNKTTSVNGISRGYKCGLKASNFNAPRELVLYEIRKAIKKIGPWMQSIGEERPEDLIEAALEGR